MQRLEGKRVFVTGAAGGIGSLVAGQLSEEGAILTGIDRVDCPICHETIIADLADQGSLESLAETLGSRSVDILVNIAGLQYFGPLERQQPTNIALGFAVNLVAPATLAAAVLPQMRERGMGQIVNIGSVMGSIAYPFFATYSSSKAGLHALSQGLRREVQGSGISVTHVAPRAVNTGFNNADVNQFIAMSGMTADHPEDVASRIVAAIERCEKDVTIGFRERFFTQLNAAFPRIVDAGLSAQTAKARALFPTPKQ